MGTTFPSHATIFTGLYPKHHGVRWNGDRLAERFTTLAELLSAAGYETAAFLSWGAMLTRGGLHQGMSEVSDLRKPGRSAGTPVRTGDEVNQLALPWLAARGNRPFFLWLHYYETHKPYRLTPFSQEKLTGHRLPEGVSLEKIAHRTPPPPWTPEILHALRILYAGEVREADRLVGEVLEALRQLDHFSNTIIVLTSDHGELLGEHGQIGHGPRLWQPVLHVPWVMHVPEVLPRRIATRVGLVDLAPTLLDLLGLPIPADIDGRSLGPAMAGKALTHRPYFAEVRAIGNMLKARRRKYRNPDRLARTLSGFLRRDLGAVAIFDGNLKGIWRHNTFRVYDLVEDPQELHPRRLSARDLELAALRNLAVLKDLAANYHDRSLIESSSKISAAVKKELESLGYIGGDN